MKKTLVFAPMALVCLSLGGCDSATSSSSPGASSAPAPATAQGSTAPAADKEKEAPGALTEIDLSPAGAAWKGWIVKAPEGTKVADSGAGGPQIATKDYQLTITEGKLTLNDIKSGAKVGAEAVQGKVTFTTDTPDAVEYFSELKDIEGKAVKTYGFGIHMKVGDKTYGCQATGPTSEAHVTEAKAVCNSLAKK